jgi:hypothetical protein
MSTPRYTSVSEVLRFIKDRVEQYQPVVEGLELEEETGCPDVSLRNLTKLIEAKQVVERISVPPDPKYCRAVVHFASGEQYLALGLGLLDADKRAALQKFVAQIGYHEYDQQIRDYDASAQRGWGFLSKST